MFFLLEHKPYVYPCQNYLTNAEAPHKSALFIDEKSMVRRMSQRIRNVRQGFSNEGISTYLYIYLYLSNVYEVLIFY